MTAAIFLISHSTRPRGGMVHTLSLAEALYRLGAPVRVVTLGDPAEGLFRPTEVPHTIVPAPSSAPTLEERVFAAVDALEDGLRRLVDAGDILHAQDCIAARAAGRIRDGAALLDGPGRDGLVVVRTVHHIDDFTTPALVECQRRSVLDPDRLLVVSEPWRKILASDYGADADVVPNGVDPGRFTDAPPVERDQTRPLVLTVGGVEPRKGTITLFEAMADLRRNGQFSDGTR